MHHTRSRRRIMTVAAAAMLVGAFMTTAGNTIAKDKTDDGWSHQRDDRRDRGEREDHRFYPPEKAGPYGIGHTTVVLTDTSRNIDGSTPVTGSPRWLHLDIWYPTTVKTDAHIRYTWNNPLYNENPGSTNYPGLPDLPKLTAQGARSFHPVAEKAPLAAATFPLLIASHGNLVSSAKNMPDTLETLASHGYVVASVEHTGNDDAYYQASFFKNYIRAVEIGPNPVMTGGIATRSRDVRFVIDAVLQGLLDNTTGMPFTQRIDADKIGVLGYSLGGQTSLATVAGIGSAGLAPDSRVKAALMSGGSNWGLLLKPSDYANARVPLLFLGNDTGIAYNDFNLFSNAPRKYLADIAGIAHHTAGYQSSWCQDFRNSMLTIKPGINGQVFSNPTALDRSDIANFIFDSTFYFTYTGSRQSGVYEYCDGSVFDGISDAQLESVFFGPSDIVAVKNELQPLMPLKPEVSLAEITRLTNWYAVSFFNQSLKGDKRYDAYLKDTGANRKENPLVDFTSSCLRERAHPLDLLPGDKISFVPQGNDGYMVSVKSGQSLYDKGPTKLRASGDASVYLSYPGFAFYAPGLRDPIRTLIVNEDGAITARTASAIGGIDDNGSPWYSRGQLLLSNRFTIAALMKNLDSGAFNATDRGVFGYHDAANQRVVVTYWNVPSVGTTEPNTLQVAIHASGRIEIIIGGLAPTGAATSPALLGTIGIATGETQARDLRKVNPINFSKMRDRRPDYMRLDARHAIYEQYVDGSTGPCGKHARNHDDD
jgi:dienelactone hydrolase